MATKQGFALVASLAILALLVMLGVSLLSLSIVSMKSATTSQNQERARANAKLALMVALGQLQKNAGPDRRVSGSAGLSGDPPQNSHWTGIWSTDPDAPLPVWLVSGNESYSLENSNLAGEYPETYFTPEDPPDQNWFTFHNSAQAEEIVRVPTVAIDEDASTISRYAWWISDEGSKARVDVRHPDPELDTEGAPLSTTERITRSRLPRENSLRFIDPEFNGLSPIANLEDQVDSRRMISMDSIDLLSEVASDPGLSEQYFHDLTIGGYGLPVNVVEGGMKTDLSIAFDSSQNTRGYDVETMGAVPTKWENQAIYDFDTISQPKNFYLITELLDKNDEPIGPNWGIIYNYSQLWRNISDTGSISGIELDPKLESDLRNREWLPYRKADSGNLRRDQQHTNSPVTPVLSMLQIGFRLSSAAISGTDDYRLQLQVKPVIGIWNPYNIPIEPEIYNVRWGIYPYMRIGIQPPDDDAYYTRTWMRTLWKKGGQPADPDDPEQDVFLWLKTRNLTDLQPGEFRLFSIDGTRNIGKSNNLVPTWSEEGSFIFNLVDQTNPGTPPSVIVPADSLVWYEDLMLEDLQHPDTWTRFFADDARDWQTASWVSFNNSNEEIHRISDFWQKPLSTERDLLPYKVPEPVLAGGDEGAPASPRLRVEDITSSGSPLHIGSWRWFSRNSADAEASQRLRGWLDTNPRFTAANPLWDSSRPAGSEGYEGWHFLSPFLGGSTTEEPYDDGPSGRGKVAEGQNEVPASPEANLAEGRYQGFGGFSSASIGQTHVPVFDVPRGPLVSLGQLQHAQFSRYQYEPALPFGNSYANPRIPLDQIMVNDYMDMENFTMYDLSYGLNEALWDNYFFSTIGRDYFVDPDSGSEATLDSVLNFEQVVSGVQALPNPRYSFHPQSGDSSFDQLLEDAGEDAPRALTARLGVEGAFNVNSTSVDAWKAVLSSLADFEFPAISTNAQTVTWADPAGIRLPRFGHVLSTSGWASGDGPESNEFWQSYRKLSQDELESLAEEIVREVRQRGPFRSLADFVNRDPEAEDINHQRKGALQAALDNTVNSLLTEEVGEAVVDRPVGEQFSEAFNGESQAGGFAGYLLQGDILQSLAPILQVRSDYFRIRAVGQSLDLNGEVVAQAVCEAYVQRVADYIDDGADPPQVAADELSSTLNQMFGRRYEIASFRWLSPDEL